MSAGETLDGKLIVATPSLGDPRFDRSVVFMCSHSDEGAMGLIINKPTNALTFNDMLEQLDIPTTDALVPQNVFVGGPVESGRGFVLHSTDYQNSEDRMIINDQFALSASLGVLEDIARGEGPTDFIPSLGYSGWGPGQLEQELRENAWLVTDAPKDLVFDGDHAQKWENALHALGIDPKLLSSTGGSA